MKNKNSIFWGFVFMLVSSFSFGQCPFIQEVRLWDNSWNNPSGQSQNNYADYTNDCIPLFQTQFTQINVTASQGNVYMAMYADLDGNGTFETQIFNFLDNNGGTGVNPTSIVQPGTPIRVIVSANPITSGDVIPTCGEAEDYVICGKECPFIESVRLIDNSWMNSTGQSPNNYEDYTNDCIPLHASQFPQLNVTASQGNVYMAIYADLDGNGTFEQVILNQLDANGGFGINLSNLPPGTPIRVIVSADPITSGDVIPTCGEAEDYVLCYEDCDCVNGGEIVTWNSSNCSIGFWLGGFAIDGCATIQPGYSWNFGDNNTATTPNNWTFHTYANPGVYTVTVSFVVVNNATGQPCTQTYSVQVKVGECGLTELVGGKGKSLSTPMTPNDLFNAQAFPNPSEDFVRFSIDNSIDTEVQPELVIYDQMGREVYRSAFDETNEQTVDFRSIGSGLYLYRISQNGELIGDGEVVIK